jgi:hypothetical protein
LPAVLHCPFLIGPSVLSNVYLIYSYSYQYKSLTANYSKHNIGSITIDYE